MSSLRRELSENTKTKMQQLRSKLKKYDSKLLELDQMGTMSQTTKYDPTDFKTKLNAIVLESMKPYMSYEEVDENGGILVNRLYELFAISTQALSSEKDLRIKEFEELAETEKELRLLTETHQLELEKQLDALRSFQVKPRKNSISRPKNLFKDSLKSSSDEYEIMINSLEAENNYLKTELEKLKELFEKTVETSACVFFEKERLKNELEDLTRDLFEEANRMVAEESRIRAQLESSNQQLSKDLHLALEQFSATLSAQKDRAFRRGSDLKITSEAIKLLASESRSRSQTFNCESPTTETTGVPIESASSM